MMIDSKPPISTAVIKQIAFIALLSLLGLLLFFYLKTYLSGVLGALVLYILLRPLHFYLIEKKKWKSIFSILLLFLLSFVVMLLPIWLTVVMLSGKVMMVIDRYKDILELLQNKVAILTELTGYNILSGETLTKISTTAAGFIPGLLSSTVGMVVQIAIMYFVLFFMLSSGRKFEKWAKEFSPFSDNATQKLLGELKKMTISNAIGMPLLGFIQALAALLGYWLIGVDEPFLWAVITGLVSVIPVVGSTIVWIPLALFVYFHGNHPKALALLLYGGLVISNVDSVFRFMVQKKMADIHPLVTFFGVLIGIEIFGFTGLIFGPLLIAYFITLISVYKEEYRS
ncbi:MAG: AI-2E family transporter [Chitinophagales bacterium]|nr:AI-2E family transporter [Chitinophagales bacterium]MCO5279911.1 AI-2E family transporter [Chitinophagales bacterium]HRN94904.1 AI-2E family transporter [Chitinophagales bacterium]